MTSKIAVPASTKKFRDERETQIREILDRGNVAKFTNPFNGVEKYVDKWEPDEDNDLLAAFSSGEVAYVCWDSHRYDVSEVTKEEVPAA